MKSYAENKYTNWLFDKMYHTGRPNNKYEFICMVILLPIAYLNLFLVNLNISNNLRLISLSKYETMKMDKVKFFDPKYTMFHFNINAISYHFLILMINVMFSLYYYIVGMFIVQIVMKNFSYKNFVVIVGLGYIVIYLFSLVRGKLINKLNL